MSSRTPGAVVVAWSLMVAAVASCSSFSGTTDAVDAGVQDASGPTDGGPRPDGGGSRYAAAVLADGPAAYWRFDDGDLLGGAFDAVSGGPLGRFTKAFVGEGALVREPGSKGMKLTGMGGVSVPGAFGFEGVASFTLEAWVRPIGKDADAGIQGVIANNAGPAVSERGFSLHRSGGKLLFEREGASKELVTATLPNSTYSHVVATFDGAMLTLYVNGVMTPPVAGTQSIAAGGTLSIGARHAGADEHLFGLIDEVAIYGKALSQAQVLAHYNAGAGGT